MTGTWCGPHSRNGTSAAEVFWDPVAVTARLPFVSQGKKPCPEENPDLSTDSCTLAREERKTPRDAHFAPLVKLKRAPTLVVLLDKADYQGD